MPQRERDIQYPHRWFGRISHRQPKYTPPSPARRQPFVAVSCVPQSKRENPTRRRRGRHHTSCHLTQTSWDLWLVYLDRQILGELGLFRSHLRHSPGREMPGRNALPLLGTRLEVPNSPKPRRRLVRSSVTCCLTSPYWREVLMFCTTSLGIAMFGERSINFCKCSGMLLALALNKSGMASCEIIYLLQGLRIWLA